METSFDDLSLKTKNLKPKFRVIAGKKVSAENYKIYRKIKVRT
jgi:hypothetical protein